ncbi:protein NRT1/ PTR FAMILY 3.1-like [Cryptomeria japonica]|uniref:protein NRT1/ PTR FAMILY 3.1-like n=1 Tax=Cryptomeria japonica TaxID=3369 RepID=UPI0027DA6B97|nr:protein NRT1/ PTR FAMILY 3.1-like [Cryptomeria japonica]
MESPSHSLCLDMRTTNRIGINEQWIKKGCMVLKGILLAGHEGCERLAIVGLLTNTMVYLRTKYNMDIVAIIKMFNIFSGTTSLATLGGAFLADSYIGRFLTILVASFSYLIGMTLWTVTALVPSLRPPHCSDAEAKLRECISASKVQMFFVVMALIFLSIGSAGIRPCALAFGADQFEKGGKKKTQQEKSLQSFFNWYWFANCTIILLGSTVIVYLQSNVSWGLGFGVCTLLMLISIIAFIVGMPIFYYEIPQGSPFTAIAQLIVASIKKRDLSLPSDPALLYYDQASPKIPVTPRFRFLEKAAIPTEGDMKADGSVARPWNVSSIHKVEDLKVLIAILPMFSCLIGNAITGGQQSTYAVFQALTMNRHMGSSKFKVPAASMSIFSLLASIMWIPLYDRVMVPLIRRVTKQVRGITSLQRMGIGYIISSLSLLVAGFVEVKRRNVAKSHGLTDDPLAVVPISVFWLVPQFFIVGLANCFHAVGYLDFFYNEFPSNLRSTALALASCMYALGDYLTAILITLVHKTTGGHGKPSWLDSNINLGRLDYFYWLLSAMEALNVVYFFFCASRYSYREIPVPDGTSEVPEMTSMEIEM